MPPLGDQVEAVWVKMRTPIRSWTGKLLRWEEWELEALAWPDKAHPRGLVRVSYLYIPFNGWIKRERIRPR